MGCQWVIGSSQPKNYKTCNGAFSTVLGLFNMIDGYIGPCNAVIGVKMCKIVQIMWTFSIAGLSVLIVTKSSDRNWVSSNTVLSTWGAWSSALSAQKCLSGEKFSCPDCDKLFRSGLGFQQHRSVHLRSKVQCSVCTEMFVRWEA